MKFYSEKEERSALMARFVPSTASAMANDVFAISLGIIVLAGIVLIIVIEFPIEVAAVKFLFPILFIFPIALTRLLIMEVLYVKYVPRTLRKEFERKMRSEYLGLVVTSLLISAFSALIIAIVVYIGMKLKG
jgi:hypothetical protein